MIPKISQVKEYDNWKKEEIKKHLHSSKQDLIGKQWLSETDFVTYKEYYNAILGFSLESKAKGDILWGRVQGTESEKKTLLYVKDCLEKAGLDEVIHEEFPCFEKQWNPTACSLTIKNESETIELTTVMTAFQSGETPPEGIEAEVVYVGEGSPSELQGRDLKDKIVLLSARCYPNALLHSGRKAFSRLIGSGAVGVIVFWQLPGNLPTAGRVGTPMGGDHKGAALPWTSIARNEGILIKCMLDNGDTVRAKMIVRGDMEQRQSGHVLGWLKGKSDKIILITMHVDGYFYAMHDNGAGVAMGLELARIFAKKAIEEREHTILFHFSGDHEVPGAGGTRVLAKKNEIMEKVLIAYQIEHSFSKQYIEEAGLPMFCNVQNALPYFVSGRQQNVTQLLQEAARIHDVPVTDGVVDDPMGDIQGFYKPFAASDSLLSAGFVEGTVFYHTTADHELDMLCDEGLARSLRMYQYILEKSVEANKDFFEYKNPCIPEKHLFTSDYFACLYSEF